MLTPGGRHDASFNGLIVIGPSGLWLLVAAAYLRIREFAETGCTQAALGSPALSLGAFVVASGLASLLSAPSLSTT